MRHTLLLGGLDRPDRRSSPLSKRYWELA
jgi:hypothetical protein